ncbi:MAG TPA: aldo/keto reductase [Candidatus Thermoplasmatota archaeon]|nr:aldo/keto reductase [Candidatus Thermoplasmatota archaeon]
MSVIGQGTWRVADRHACCAAIGEGLRLGLTHIDTAELYERQSGSETMLGEALSRLAPDGRPWRSHVYLASKVMPPNATAKGIPSACKDSLVRLQTGELDLYYHHWRGTTPLEETLRAMADLVDQGWVRHIGVSNYDLADLEEAETVLGKGRIAANQVRYHVADRGAEQLLPWCRSRKCALVAYSPLGAGSFPTGKRLALLQDVGRGLGLDAHQVALAFLLRNPEVFAIPKAERLAHVRLNAAADVDLPPDAVQRIEAAFPLVPGLRTL